ncbi:MAG: diphthine synthase [Nanoarchaeota archaeon]|nr:diphthine synthase [Nanoarchaeota archaeon]
MFYLIGLGLTVKSISADALDVLKKCDKVYLENYTIDFPYSGKELNKSLGIKIISLARSDVEDELIIKEAKEKNVALLVYGDSLSATTHMQLILSCKKQNVKFKVFHNASILTAVGETGLSLYKFGKVASIPDWKEHKNKPTSFMNYIKENLLIKAHTLLLTDIGLNSSRAIEQLKQAVEKEKVKLPSKIIILSNAGAEKQKIFYDTLDELSAKKVEMPFCFIIPSEMHFLEEGGVGGLIWN